MESSHSGVKMRLRLGRGLHRHNLQAVLDFEDFIYNRTNGDPADVFKKLGDAANKYVTTVEFHTKRKSVRSYSLPEDNVEAIQDLTRDKIVRLCTTSVFNKAKKYERKNSDLFRTQSSALRNCITGQYRAARIHDQHIIWGNSSPHIYEQHPFSLFTIKVYCSCITFLKKHHTLVPAVHI